MFSIAGKKDTPAAAVQEVTQIAGELPLGIDRVTSILAGRVKLPVVNMDTPSFRALHTSAGQSAQLRPASWRSFAADGSRRSQ